MSCRCSSINRFASAEAAAALFVDECLRVADAVPIRSSASRFPAVS
jgi:hypothetical protein